MYEFVHSRCAQESAHELWERSIVLAATALLTSAATMEAYESKVVQAKPVQRRHGRMGQEHDQANEKSLIGSSAGHKGGPLQCGRAGS
jgi:hypothetical protein